MEAKTKTSTEQILTVMRILAWVAFFGLLIQTGAILISYVVSWVNPEAARNLYKGLNLYDLSQMSFWHYTQAVSFKIALTCMKAYVCFLVIRTLTKVNLANPFTTDVARLLERISYLLLGTWIVGTLQNAHTSWLIKRTGILDGDWAAGEFFFMAGLVFIISHIFKRGVELQSENDLTV